MTIKISNYITAADENDYTKGSKIVWTVEVEKENGAENHPNQTESAVLKLVAEFLKEGSQAC
jgi:hypothetical protein